ncbi:MAG: tannase/feruloyl esterase family alpha/beta hydrolase [Bacteroidales bacterium]|nr:tannase/feruloyl esterase family alpha/beta hydrolase [Bacteroidales bacterium]
MNISHFTISFVLSSFIYTAALCAQQPDYINRCTDHPEFRNVTIMASESVMNGIFTIPGTEQTIAGLPPFQRVALTVHPTPESNIRIEVWMPEQGWNGRFLGTGNGGGAGSISYGIMAAGLKRGFAVANTDMGTSPYANYVIEYPERWKDFGHRATHEMTVKAKNVITEYYGQSPRYSYFFGCSTGGQQALSEAQRYPEDYDGIIAGAPANNRTHLHTGFLWNYKVTNTEPGCKFSPEELRLITETIIKVNAGKDGGAPGDNFLTDPRLAKFDFDCLDTLLTRKQIETLKKIFSGPINPTTGEQIYTSFPLGSESQPMGLAYQQDKSVTEGQFYQFLWLWGNDFDYTEFDFDKDMELVDSKLASVLNANNPDLRAFVKRGGKMIMYTGTCDPIVPFQDAIHYYERVTKEMGGLKNTQKFFRYFLVPGMAHCGNGPGLNEFGQFLSGNVPEDREHDLMTALISWVEQDKAPEKLIATSFNEGEPQKGIRLRRPIFPYPAFPHYKGGDPAQPSSFKAVVHKRGNVPVPAGRYLE